MDFPLAAPRLAHRDAVDRTRRPRRDVLAPRLKVGRDERERERRQSRRGLENDDAVAEIAADRGRECQHVVRRDRAVLVEERE